MGYVALTTHLRPSNYGVSDKRLECIPSNSCRPSSIESDARYRWQWADVPFTSDSSFFHDIQNHNTIVAVYKRPAAVWPVSISMRRRQLQLLVFKTPDSAINRSTHTIDTVRPAHYISTLLSALHYSYLSICIFHCCLHLIQRML